MRKRRILIWALAMASGLAIAPWTEAATTNFDVGASGAAAYVIGAVNNPTLTLTRGQTYTFTVTAGGHPFWIATQRGSGDTESHAFSTGVTNNGASPGTVTFVVPASAPATLFYQCAFHDPMGGTLTIVSPPPSIPATGSGALAVLAGLLLAAAAVLLRRRAQKIAAMRSQVQ